MVKKGYTLLCIDVGNTSTSYGLYGGGRFLRMGHSPTVKFPRLVLKLLSNKDNIPNRHAVIASVVPKITLKIRKSLSQLRGVRIWEVGGNLQAGIKHNYKYINKLGPDRLVTAYGASRLYGAPVLILDFGTALTCDFISSKGVFEGGLIIPGPQISLQALSERAALLPSINFPKRHGSLIGRDTRGCMKAGILQGYGAMADGLVAKFRKRYGRRFRVVATGGLARTLAPYTTQIDVVDPLLTLKSLARLFRDKIISPPCTASKLQY